MLLSLLACVDNSEPDHQFSVSKVPSDTIFYDLGIDSTHTTVSTSGSGGPNRIEGDTCAPSFSLQFFTSNYGAIGEESASYVRVYLPDYTIGARSLMPELDDQLERWAPPQWRLSGEIRAAFGGVTELIAYDPDRVALQITDTTLCTVPLWGVLSPGEILTYEELATDCTPVSAILLDAIASPIGSFEQTRESEQVGDDSWGNIHPWRNELGENLCD